MLKNDWSLPRRSEVGFVEGDLGQTNEQKRHFKLGGEVDSIQTSLITTFTFQQLWNIVSTF
jgi:hypothetical protein